MWAKVSTRRGILALLILAIIVVSVASTAFILLPIYEQRTVAVVEIYDEITSHGERDYILDMIDYSRTNDTIKAVVLKIDSPGGWADAVEDIYLDLLRLKEKKPIVASIVGLGVSGSYHIAISADYIYMVPAAMVGNIGVVATLPEKVEPREDVMETGPYKRRGISEREFPFQVQSLLNSFLDSVEARRGGKLRLDRAELSKGLMYIGEEAVRNGLADGIGSDLDAVKKAASLAQIEQYSVVTVNDVARKRYWSYSSLSREHRSLRLDDLFDLRPPPAFYYIYVSPKPGNSLTASTTWREPPKSTITGSNKTILIDYSHENVFAHWELNTLLYEIASRGFSVRYLNSTTYLKERLKEAEAFLVINPGTFLSETEVNATKEYVKGGGKLLLIMDPTRTYASPMNSLSSEFGLVFAMGYLYSLQENYGNYRNIYLTNFKNSTVTKGLSRVVFYTTAYIYPTGGEIAYTSASTFSSESEISKEYSPIVLLEGKILALGDQTFLGEPYCYAYDDYKLIQNIADFLTE